MGRYEIKFWFYLECSLRGCDTVYSHGQLPKFWRKLVLHLLVPFYTRLSARYPLVYLAPQRQAIVTLPAFTT
jgi:hypothetical protein